MRSRIARTGGRSPTTASSALKEIHQLQLVHLDIKGDNVCIPFGPANFDPEADGAPLYPLFGQLALIDFAFSLVSGESLDRRRCRSAGSANTTISRRACCRRSTTGHDGDLRTTRELDWRCDIYSLAAMLKRYLPDDAARASAGTGDRMDERALRRREGADPDASPSPRSRRAANGFRTRR